MNHVSGAPQSSFSNSNFSTFVQPRCELTQPARRAVSYLVFEFYAWTSIRMRVHVRVLKRRRRPPSRFCCLFFSQLQVLRILKQRGRCFGGTLSLSLFIADHRMTQLDPSVFPECILESRRAQRPEVKTANDRHSRSIKAAI